MSNKFSILSRIKSFKYAINGLKILFIEEHNARVHLVSAILTISLSIYYKISKLEWIAIIIAICLVFSLEIINSAIENISDFIHPEKHEKIKRIKDLSASCVLIGAISAFIIGLIVFIPKIIAQCQSY